MARQMTGVTPKFRATVAILGLGVLCAMVLWGAGCSRNSSEYSQFPANAEGLFLAGIRPPAGDTNRLLRNAHYLKLLGRQELAMRELEAAYQQDPRNIKVLNTLALACDEMGEFSRAQKLYQEALALDVSNQALNNNLCFSYYLAGQWDKAETCFRQALTRNPRNIMARNNLGLLLCRRGRNEEARRLWEGAEGKIVAQRKMQQVMVALGVGDASHYAQLPESAAVAAAPLPEPSTPSPAVDGTSASPKVALPKPDAPKPRVPEAPPSKIRQPIKLAANTGPAANPPGKSPAPVTAVPQSKKIITPAPAQQPPAAPKPVAKSAPAVTPIKTAPQVSAAAPAKPRSLPPRPKQTADTEKKPAPAATPPPPARPVKIKLSKAPAPVQPKPEKSIASGIEVANATGAFNLARRTRAKLKEQGFKVVTISNNHGRYSEGTVIYYRPEAEKVARDLNVKFFPNSRLELGDKFARNTNVKVVLGKDILAPPAVADKAALKAEKIAAGPGANQAKSPPAAATTVAPVKVAARPAKPAPVKVAARKSRGKTYLTAQELVNMAVEIRNGSGAHNLAHMARSMLSQEGFYVARIGNHIDFGAERTVIYYRPGAEKMARNLSSKFFSNSTMEQTAKLPEDIAVKVLLGKDLLQRTEVMARLDD